QAERHLEGSGYRGLTKSEIAVCDEEISADPQASGQIGSHALEIFEADEAITTLSAGCGHCAVTQDRKAEDHLAESIALPGSGARGHEFNSGIGRPAQSRLAYLDVAPIYVEPFDACGR